MEASGFYTFLPRRQPGYLFLLGVMGLLAFGVAFGLWQASRAGSAQSFLFYLLTALLAAVLLPFFGYRLYGLMNSSYAIGREGIRLRWGWRIEDIPSNEVEWVGNAQKYSQPLPYPRIAFPGAVLGVRRMPDGRLVEFLADRFRNLVLIATPRRIFVISPHDPGDFLVTYRRLMEFGSLSPLPAQSVAPSLLPTLYPANQPRRWLVLGNVLLSLVLYAVVALAVQGRDQISLRFTPQGVPLDYVPAVRLFLLPVLSTLFLLADGFLGLFFYRREELRPLAYLLWVTGLVTGGLFLAAVILILRFG